MAIKIMLDAGHYAKYNRSPVLPDYWESEVMWDLHLRLKAVLEFYGFTVLTTRPKQEEDLPVYTRGKAAKGCDLFISLHSNAASQESVDHVAIYHAFDNRNQSEVLAGQIAAAVADLMEVSAGYVKTRESQEYPGREYYGVLRGARAAQVPLFYIFEHSFHTNLRAATWLLQPANRARLAAVEAAIIAQYYQVAPPQPVKGDVNGDGVLDAKDYQLIKRHVLGITRLTDEQQALADLNGDGRVTARDYTLAKRAVLGLTKL